MSSSDRKLQSIFQLFELTKKSSIASLMDHWSSSPDVTSVSALQSIQSLDSTRVFRTCLHFPLGNDTSEEGSSHTNLGTQIYDPQFVLLLVARMLETEVPTSALSWVQMLRTNVVSLLIRTLSAHDDDLRDGAMIQLSRLHHHLQVCRLIEIVHHAPDLLLRSRTQICKRNHTFYTSSTSYETHILSAPRPSIHDGYQLTSRYTLLMPSAVFSIHPILHIL